MRGSMQAKKRNHLMKIVLKEYLEWLRAVEVMKTVMPDGGKRKKVPSLTELARLSGLGTMTVYRMGNNNAKVMKLETISAIIRAMRGLGFDTQVSDLLVYQEINTNGEEVGGGDESLVELTRGEQ